MLRCGKVGHGTAEDRLDNGTQCPSVSVVLGDVINIGESALRFVAVGPTNAAGEISQTCLFALPPVKYFNVFGDYLNDLARWGEQ